MTLPTVEIVYRRPPDRVEVFSQTVLLESAECVVTFLAAAGVSRPIEVEGRVILEPGSPVVWFTFPGAWHDIGRFHRADGEFTGYYANILTPVVIGPGRWETTDLFLDVWLGRGGHLSILDETEFREAVEAGWVDEVTAARARSAADDLARGARTGDWPPPIVDLWTLDRARKRIADSGDAGGAPVSAPPK